MNNNFDASRRKFLKTAGYVTPAVLTLAAIPSFASAGSARHGGGNNTWQGGGNFPHHWENGGHRRR
jgi:hypothetical protein